MIVEKWFDKTSPVLILRDHEKGLVYDAALQAKPPSEQKRLLQEGGQPLVPLRHMLLEQHAKRQLTIQPFRFQRFLENRGEHAAIPHVRSVDFSDIHTNSRILLNELTFIGASVAQGFIDFYDIEIAGIVASYERRLRIISEENKETGQTAVYISKLFQGHVKYLSPDLQTPENAQETLRHFQKQQAAKRRVAIDSPSMTLTQKREDDPYEKE